MAISMEIKCDVCGEFRKPTNGWTLARVHADHVTFEVWQDQVATHDDMNHLCGTECEAKFLTRITSKWREASHVNT